MPFLSPVTLPEIKQELKIGGRGLNSKLVAFLRRSVSLVEEIEGTKLEGLRSGQLSRVQRAAIIEVVKMFMTSPMPKHQEIVTEARRILGKEVENDALASRIHRTRPGLGQEAETSDSPPASSRDEQSFEGGGETDSGGSESLGSEGFEGPGTGDQDSSGETET